MCDRPFCPARYLAQLVEAAFCEQQLPRIADPAAAQAAMLVVAEACLPFAEPAEVNTVLTAIERAGAVRDAERLLEENRPSRMGDEDAPA